MDIQSYWDAVFRQDAAALRACFHPAAYINWHCTNERFTVEEFVRANCEYPGQWGGVIERVETVGDLTVTAVRVASREDSTSFHAVSFIRLVDDKIAAIDEYWGDDGPPPQWRQEKHIGSILRL